MKKINPKNLTFVSKFVRHIRQLYDSETNQILFFSTLVKLKHLYFDWIAMFLCHFSVTFVYSTWIRHFWLTSWLIILFRTALNNSFVAVFMGNIKSMLNNLFLTPTFKFIIRLDMTYLDLHLDSTSNSKHKIWFIIIKTKH